MIKTGNSLWQAFQLILQGNRFFIQIWKNLLVFVGISGSCNQEAVHSTVVFTRAILLLE